MSGRRSQRPSGSSLAVMPISTAAGRPWSASWRGRLTASASDPWATPGSKRSRVTIRGRPSRDSLETRSNGVPLASMAQVSVPTRVAAASRSRTPISTRPEGRRRARACSIQGWVSSCVASSARSTVSRVVPATSPLAATTSALLRWRSPCTETCSSSASRAQLAPIQVPATRAIRARPTEAMPRLGSNAASRRLRTRLRWCIARCRRACAERSIRVTPCERRPPDVPPILRRMLMRASR